MAAHSPGSVRACVFDAYGTLFDFASAARRCRDVLGDSFEKLTVLWRDKQLQYTWLRAAQGRHADFWQVTGDALDFSLETLMLDQPGLRARLMELYLTLDTFPEIPDVLRQLKAAGLRSCRTERPKCSLRLSRTQGSTACSIVYSRSRRLASTSRIRECISSRSTSLVFPPRKFPFSPQTPGMLMRRHLLE